MPEAFIDQVLGCRIPMSAKEQKETFQAIVEMCIRDSSKALAEAMFGTENSLIRVEDVYKRQGRGRTPWTIM